LLVPHVININRAKFEVSSLTRSLVVYMHAKFHVFSFTRSEDMEGVPFRRYRGFKSTSSEPIAAAIDLFFHFFVASVIKIRAKFAGSSNSHSRDMMGVSKFKIVGNMTPSRPRSGVSFTAHFDLILHFFVSAPCGLYACQICSF